MFFTSLCVPASGGKEGGSPMLHVSQFSGLFTGHANPRGSDRVGSGRVGSGRVRKFVKRFHVYTFDFDINIQDGRLPRCIIRSITLFI